MTLLLRAEPWAAGPSSYPLVVERKILRSRNLNRKISYSLPAVGLELLNLELLGHRPNHEGLVERIILELPDEL